MMSIEGVPRVAQQSCLVQTTPRSWLEHWLSVAFLKKLKLIQFSRRSVNTCSRVRFDNQSHNSVLCSRRHMHTCKIILTTVNNVIEWRSF